MAAGCAARIAPTCHGRAVAQDVCFRRKVETEDVLLPLVQQRANFFHAKLIVDNGVCELTLGDMLQLYVRTRRHTLARVLPTSRQPARVLCACDCMCTCTCMRRVLTDAGLRVHACVT